MEKANHIRNICLGEWWFTMVETIKDHQQKHIQVQDWTHQPLTCKSMLQKTPATSQHVRQEEVIEMSSPTFTYDRNAKGNTVDERSPAPAGIHKTLQIMGWTTNLSWLAGFLPSTSYVIPNSPTWIHPKIPFKARHKFVIFHGQDSNDQGFPRNPLLCFVSLTRLIWKMILPCFWWGWFGLYEPLRIHVWYIYLPYIYRHCS